MLHVVLSDEQAIIIRRLCSRRECVFRDPQNPFKHLYNYLYVWYWVAVGNAEWLVTLESTSHISWWGKGSQNVKPYSVVTLSESKWMKVFLCKHIYLHDLTGFLSHFGHSGYVWFAGLLSLSLEVKKHATSKHALQCCHNSVIYHTKTILSSILTRYMILQRAMSPPFGSTVYKEYDPVFGVLFISTL